MSPLQMTLVLHAVVLDVFGSWCALRSEGFDQARVEGALVDDG